MVASEYSKPQSHCAVAWRYPFRLSQAARLFALPGGVRPHISKFISISSPVFQCHHSQEWFATLYLCPHCHCPGHDSCRTLHHWKDVGCSSDTRINTNNQWFYAPWKSRSYQRTARRLWLSAWRQWEPGSKPFCYHLGAFQTPVFMGKMVNAESWARLEKSLVVAGCKSAHPTWHSGWTGYANGEIYWRSCPQYDCSSVSAAIYETQGHPACTVPPTGFIPRISRGRHFLCSAGVLLGHHDIPFWFLSTTIPPLHSCICCVQLHVARPFNVDKVENTRNICGRVRITLDRMETRVRWGLLHLVAQAAAKITWRHWVEHTREWT